MNVDHFKNSEGKKENLINTLIHSGVYKKGNHQLFELSLPELEEEYDKLVKGEQDR